MQPIIMSKTFLYFAYGSNMLAQRIHMNNPSAVRIGTGKLNVCDIIILPITKLAYFLSNTNHFSKGIPFRF